MAEALAFTHTDAKYMARALRLAEKGQLSVTPNPSVGCVLVSKAGEVVGEGYHVKAGTAHAEVHALTQAGEKAKNATAYVTLEPCSHFGRTGPCALALIEAGVSRVVIACVDVNPQVAGNGVKLLEDAGIEVCKGLMQKAAENVNLGYFTRMRTAKPYVILKLAASLDGKTALGNGESQWITSPDARRDVQLERAKSCAILTGSGTALSDDPRLNVRSDELRNRAAAAFNLRGAQPLRVVIDGRNQLRNDLIMLTDGKPTRVYNLRQRADLCSNAVVQVQLPSAENERHVDLSRMLDDLAGQQINRLWVEAGAKLAGALLDANLVDELVLYMAPKILGGGAMELLTTAPKNHLQEAINAHISSIEQIGPDIKIKSLLRGV
jgi:diaminohydroxyphosphoribosylaminopyrimidine deaminase/5-amino-6-(5-phosphoribosylamino)uracil reductase